MQCMATAMFSGAAATGMRAWIAAHAPSWMTPRRLKLCTAAILVVGVVAAGANIAPNAPTAKASSNATTSPQGAGPP
jgi:hypothetical protein